MVETLQSTFEKGRGRHALRASLVSHTHTGAALGAVGAPAPGIRTNSGEVDGSDLDTAADISLIPPTFSIAALLAVVVFDPEAAPVTPALEEPLGAGAGAVPPLLPHPGSLVVAALDAHVVVVLVLVVVAAAVVALVPQSYLGAALLAVLLPPPPATEVAPPPEPDPGIALLPLADHPGAGTVGALIVAHFRRGWGWGWAEGSGWGWDRSRSWGRSRCRSGRRGRTC